jgi:exodeoxyribonuclease III
MGYTDVYRALHPGVRAYTWWYVNIGGRDRLDTPGLGRRIDYFLMPNEYMRWVTRCDILREYLGADHCPLVMEIDMDR